MGLACSRRRSTRKFVLAGPTGWGAWLSLALLLLWSFPSSAAADISIVPSAEGRLGAWLALGPIAATSKGNRAPRNMEQNALAGADESALVGKFGRTVSITAQEGDPDASTTASWRVLSSGSGPIDVAA